MMIQLIRNRVVPALLVLAALSGISFDARAQAPRAAAAAGPVLAPGDLLRVIVWRRADLSGDFPIAVDGTIVHPLYRRIHAAGVQMPALEDRIRTFLLDFEANPQFVVQPLFRVFVAGEIRQPGMLSLSPGTTIAQAIAMAGGPTDDGRLDEVRLIRNLNTTMLDLTSGDSATTELPVRSSDQITIGRRRQFVRDRLLPTASVIAALASVANVVLFVVKK